jgi:hypothetical protein
MFWRLSVLVFPVTDVKNLSINTIYVLNVSHANISNPLKSNMKPHCSAKWIHLGKPKLWHNQTQICLNSFVRERHSMYIVQSYHFTHCRQFKILILNYFCFVCYKSLFDFMLCPPQEGHFTVLASLPDFWYCNLLFFKTRPFPFLCLIIIKLL